MIKVKHVFGFGFILSLLAYQLHGYLWENAFFQLMSLSITCFIFTIVMMSTGQFFWFAKFVFLASIINVLDEFVFYPCKVPSMLEYLCWVFIFIYYYLNYSHWKK